MLFRSHRQNKAKPMVAAFGLKDNSSSTTYKLFDKLIVYYVFYYYSLKFEGRYITIGFTAGIPKIPANILLLKSASAVGLWWGNTMQTAPEVFNESVETVLNMYLDGKIDPLVQQSVPLDQVSQYLNNLVCTCLRSCLCRYDRLCYF